MELLDKVDEVMVRGRRMTVAAVVGGLRALFAERHTPGDVVAVLDVPANGFVRTGHDEYAVHDRLRSARLVKKFGLDRP